MIATLLTLGQLRDKHWGLSPFYPHPESCPGRAGFIRMFCPVVPEVFPSCFHLHDDPVCGPCVGRANHSPLFMTIGPPDQGRFRGEKAGAISGGTILPSPDTVLDIQDSTPETGIRLHQAGDLLARMAHRGVVLVAEGAADLVEGGARHFS